MSAGRLVDDLEARAPRVAARAGLPLLPAGCPRRGLGRGGRRRLGRPPAAAAGAPRRHGGGPLHDPARHTAAAAVRCGAHHPAPRRAPRRARSPPPGPPLRPASPMVLSSNAGTTFEEIAATGVNWWLQIYVTADRPACRAAARAGGRAGATAVVLTADTPVVGTKYDEGPTVWDVSRPGGFGSTSRDVRRRSRATRRPPTWPGDVAWLLRQHRAARGGEGRAAPGGRPPLRRGGRRGDLGVQPRRPPARRGGRDGGPTRRRRRSGGGGAQVSSTAASGRRARRSSPSVWGQTWCSSAASRSMPSPPTAPAGVRRLLDELAEDLEEALRLLGCPSVDRLGPGFLAS